MSFEFNRLLSPINQLEDLSEAVNLYDCACPARSVVNGVAEIEGDFIVNVPEKSKYVEFVTPEFIKCSTLQKALNKKEKEFPCLVEYALIRLKAVYSTFNAIKCKINISRGYNLP